MNPKLPLEKIFENALDAVLAINSHSVIIQWNHHAEKIFGWEKNEILGKNLAQTLIPYAYREAHKKGLEIFLETGEGKFINRRAELTALRKNGTEFPVELTITPIKFESEWVFFSFLRDLTQEKKDKLLITNYQKNLVKKIKKNIKFLDTIFENVPNMIFVKDAKDLTFVNFNKAGTELLGYTKNELIGKNDYVFFSKSEADYFTEKDRNTLASGEIIDIPEEQIQTKFKGTRILHTRKVTLYDENGKPEFLLGVSEDITEKKKAEEYLRNLNQEKIAREEAEKSISLRDEFISIAAHELNTPLTALTLQLQLINKLLTENISLDKKNHIQNLLHGSLSQAERLSSLIENLLDTTRASIGKLVLRKTKVDLSELVRRVIQLHEIELKKMNYSYQLQLEPEVIGFWDSLRIEQVVSNLLSNAIKFGEGKPIEISVSSGKHGAILIVKDHGIGLNEENQDRVFNRFERAASIKTYAGLGLGLYISKQIISAHGGTIRIESEPGKGSSFIVELPF